MDRLTKTFYIVVAVLAALVILFFVAVNIAVHHIDWRHVVEKQVKKQTGRDLVLKGKLKLGVFPSIKIETENASLGNPPGFPKTPFMSINKIDISVETWPLLTGRIKVKSFTIDGAAIHLVQNSVGAANWNFTDESTKHTQSNVSATQKTHLKRRAKHVLNTSKENQAVLLNIPQLMIKNASVTWQDLKTGKQFLLTHFNLSASQVRQANRFPVNISFDIANTKPKLTGQVKLSAKVLMINNEVDLTPLSASLHLRGDSLPQKKLDGNFSAMFAIVTPKAGGLSVHLDSGSFNLNQLALSNINAHLTLNHEQLSINPFTANLYQGSLDTQLSANLTTMTFRNHLVLSNVQLGDLLQKFDHKNFQGTANAGISLTGSLNKPLPSLNGHGHFNVTDGQYKGIDLAYLYRLAVNTLKPGSLGSLPNRGVTKFGNASADFAINQGVLSSNNLNVTSPVLRIRGKGKSNLITQTLNWRLTVTGMQGSSNHLRVAGPDIPFNVTGTFEHVHAQPDLKALLQTEVKQRVQGELKDRLKHINLGKLFG